MTLVNTLIVGKQYTVTQLAKEYNLDKFLIYSRLDSGWSIEDTVEMPVR